MRDNQIIDLPMTPFFEVHFNPAKWVSEIIDGLPEVKHIPVECWSEVKYNLIIGTSDNFIAFGEDGYLRSSNVEQYIRNQGGRTYLVTVIGKDK